MQHYEPGHYSFRAVGIDHTGEMLIIYSNIYCINGYADMRQQQNEFLKYCRDQRHVADPKLTHTIREKEAKPNYDEYLF